MLPPSRSAHPESQEAGKVGAALILHGILAEWGGLQETRQGREIGYGKLVHPAGCALPVTFHGDATADSQLAERG